MALMRSPSEFSARLPLLRRRPPTLPDALLGRHRYPNKYHTQCYIILVGIKIVTVKHFQVTKYFAHTKN